MDDPGISWPFWKFGLKRDDLVTTLHDQYNTFPSAIQDPEAFHHDVFELSTEASSADEFHRLMATRKEQRLRELNDSMEMAAIHIIANPILIGTDQWQYAVQLFRTRSLDSLIRYFASYLPDDTPWRRPDSSLSSASSQLGSESVDDDCVTDSSRYSDPPTFFTDEKPMFTAHPEPFHDVDDAPHNQPLPPSPESMAMCSDSSSVSSDDHFVLTPPRSLSFSESEPDHVPFKDSIPSLALASHHHHDTDSRSVSSVSDMSETHHQKELLEEPFEEHEVSIVEDDGPGYPGSQLPDEEDDFESKAPTPKPMPNATPTTPAAVAASFFFEAKPSPLSSTVFYPRRSTSPTRTHLASHAASSPLTAPVASDVRRHLQPATMPSSSPARSSRRRDVSPLGKARRSGCSLRGPPTSSSGSIGGCGRIQKHTPEPLRSRPRGRRREDGC